ncbi:hypothetical protein [Acinetobacter colistiniresistens]|uniref:hypothetical protein n=1 Tax=Acinetobacter colistiniresistens TaxID=280145 RepID=UPI00279604B1|nr:hypothetical protein [Acinetobacter colistiniresistens]
MEAALVNVTKNLQAVTDFEITGINIDVEWEIKNYHHFFEKDCQDLILTKNRIKLFLI